MMRKTCKECSIRHQALCHVVPDAVLSQIDRVSWRRTVPAGRTLFGIDEAYRIVANIVSGVVKLSTSLSDGRTQIVALQFASDFIGRPFAEPAPLLMEAATDVELCCFDRRHFEAILLEHADVVAEFTRRMAADLDEARAWMLLLGHKSAEEKVASLVLLCSRRLDRPRDCADMDEPALHIMLPLSRTEIGEFLGLTIETVGRMLRRLEKDGVIALERGRGVRILDFERLVGRSEQCRA